MDNPAHSSRLPDGGAERVRLEDWGTVVDHLDDFCLGGECSAEDDRVVCEFPNARLAVSRDGTVETGMPLHTFEREGVETLLVDHERGELTVAANGEDERLEYTFHRP
jgi:hypothetical protein